ncbi:outer membrane lipoprotein-sorting protein [Vibrio hannami]|uniref:outer membrane lipoprotein-sorting protein n=1 Tax=Vibrio hannami TaxID=2717094 RepID=UPI00241050FB|nr:outer membrane lipoprotein-sorting protein [Vibrio hannami]MDG3085726.1 outer membrane lipoprotein-sorting protein [Vibrio hannami]
MYKYLKVMMFVFASFLSFGVASQEADVNAMLERADRYRLQEGASKVVSNIHLYKRGEHERSQLYHVYLRENRESLVIFKSQVEAGQKMLMLGDNYWLLMPKSRRPIRITPMQKLLGEASVGDISTLTWSDDYQGKWIKQEDITLESGETFKTNLLELNAKTKGATYYRIELWLEQGSDFPVSANMYLRSGKMAKVATFTKGARNGLESVLSMTLVDKIQSEKMTKVEYLSVEPKVLSDKYYNPAYLSRNNVSEL